MYLGPSGQRHKLCWAAWPKRVLVAAMVLAAGAGIDGGLLPVARSEPPEEYQIKAVFLYHFAQFVEWPAESFADAASPIVLGVVGDSAVAFTLNQTLRDRVAQGRKIVVTNWGKKQDGQRYQILFIPSSAAKSATEVLQSIKEPGVLVVGEKDGFAERGGMINFILSGTKLSFEINQKSAGIAGLKISSKLLALAKVVWE